MTNYEKIKAMSVEEMAKFIGYNDDICTRVAVSNCDSIEHCWECTLKFLLQEAEE